MCSLGGMDDIGFILVLLIESDSRTEKGRWGTFWSERQKLEAHQQHFLSIKL